MPRKTKEERLAEQKAQIDAIVQEKLKEKRKEDCHKAKFELTKSIIEDAIRRFKFENLNFNYLLDLYKYLVGAEQFSEEELDDIRYEFAHGMIWCGSPGIKSDEEEIVKEMFWKIVTMLKEL